MQKSGRLQTFFKEHKVVAFSILAGFLLIIAIIVVIFTTTNDNDGVLGTDSSAVDASMKQDQEALKNFPITSSLPIISKDPAYTISYQLDRDDAGNYSLQLVLNAFAASARNAMIKRFLEENFGKEDPLTYDLILENYFNPFTNYSLDDLASNNLPTNITKGNLYQFGDSPYTVQIFTHTLYDGSTNTYRAIYENGQSKTKPQLLFTYKDLPFLDQSQVKSLNSLE
ncbi:hypothetical protein IKL45_00805 [Candidatus Saccharibacteria bacterium]|nr:hypothetical protein [Candidatus Saccharibacteria bacterium]MBR6122974.1 hypothetical protein [Candidatus Saccharibacteria bacterium]